MAFNLPDLEALVERARIGFRTYLMGTDAWVWPNNLYVSAKVIGGSVFEAINFLAYIKKAMFVHTAPDIESVRLHGEEFGIAQKPAAPAQGKATFTASTALTVADNAVLRRADGRDYRVTAGGVLAAPGSLQVSVVASLDGIDGNLDAGASLEIISGVTGTATVVSGPDKIAFGADVEDIEAYRARIHFRKKNPPHGGAPADYVMWGEQVTGVTRVFVERRWNGGGTVRVFVMMDDAFPNGIPDATNVARVQDYIDTVAPAGAIVTVAAPVAHPINITVALSPNTVAAQEAVLEELRDAFFRLGRPAGADVAHSAMPYLASPATFSKSWISQAISNAVGETSHILTAPIADEVIPVAQIATLGTVSFI